VREILEGVSSIATLVFVVACMAAAGLSLEVKDITTQLRRGRLILAAVVVNFVLAPAIAFGLTQLIPLERPHTIGLFLLGGAAGAPFLPKLAELSRGDLAFSVSLMLLLMTGSVLFMPLVLPQLIPGLSAEPWPILRPLLLTMMLPLGLGILVRNRSERTAAWLRPLSGWISNLSMVLAVLLLLGLNLPAILGTFGTGAVFVGTAFVSLSLAAGCVLGGPDPRVRSTLALGTAQRNIAAAMLLALQNFPDEPGVMAMLLVTTFAGLAVLLIAARQFARQ